MRERQVVVVGGGSTGTSVLYHLAKGGVRNPLLVEMAPLVGAGQTSRSTALVRTHYSTEVLTRMAMLSYQFFKNFGKELPGRSAGYVETGLVVGADDASASALKENSSMHNNLGIDSRLMRPEDFAKSGVEPMLDAKGFSLLAYEPNSGYAEPSATASSFASSATELGAEILTGGRVTEIERASSGQLLVATAQGQVACDNVVLATGVWSRPLFAKMGIDLPVKVSRHPVAVFGRPSSYLGVRPAVFDFVRSAYYKPEGKELFFVGTLAKQVDASGAESDPNSYEEGITYEEAADFSRSAADAFPVMARGTYRRGYAGLYDNTPDQHPIIDELSGYGYPGVFCVVGLSGHGFKLAPEFGRIVASLLVGGRFSDYDVSVFRLKRFEEGRHLGGRYGVSTIA